MAYVLTQPRLGTQPIANSDTTQRHQLGTRVFASDPVYGDGEFIYLKGVASTVVGSVVTWDGATTGTPTYQTALMAASSANTGQPVAISMSVNLATGFGWYQISGTAVVVAAVLGGAGVKVFSNATAGTVSSAVLAGQQIVNARSDSATGTPSAGLAVLQIEHPFVQGQIT